MGLFGKSRKPVAQVVPCETEFDQAWFADWSSKIFRDSGTDESDPANQAGLTSKVMRLMNYWGTVPMEANGAQAELVQFRSYLSGSDATPWGAMSFIAGWDDRALPAIEDQLQTSLMELTEIASRDGNLYEPTDGWG
jgi:hypothetical protein